VQAARRFNPTHSQLHQVAQILRRTTQVTAHMGNSVRPVGAWELEKLVRRQVPTLKAQEMRRQMMRIEGQMCVIERRIAGYGQALGSGFLVGPDVVLTNYHVVENYLQGNQAQNLQVRFDALLQEEGVRQPEEGSVVPVEAIPIARPYTPDDSGNVKKPPSADDLDFALLLLVEEAGKAQVGGVAGPGQSKIARGWLQLPDPAPVLEVGDPLIIYQYPGGRELMMAIDTEAIVGTVWDGLRLRYRNNTERGSSGSPVFNFAWELVALHHGGAPGPEPAAYNQGIPAACIRAHLQAEGMLSLLGE
jgi:V8-like Glu-specific endopeptidase